MSTSTHHHQYPPSELSLPCLSRYPPPYWEGYCLWKINSSTHILFLFLFAPPITTSTELTNYFSMETYSPSIPSDHHPLLSTIITLYTLILLYFPHIFLKALLSPVFISTTILLLSLLKLGATQKSSNTKNSPGYTSKQPESLHADQNPAQCDPNPISESESKDQNPYYFDPLVEWDVSAPLEVIFEEYGEGEELDDEENDSGLRIEERTMNGRYPCLSRYYPESESDSELDSSSDEGEDLPVTDRWDSRPEVPVWKEGDRDDEDEDDRLIEIEINDDKVEGMKMIEIQGFDEENLIEIEIFSGER